MKNAIDIVRSCVKQFKYGELQYSKTYEDLRSSNSNGKYHQVPNTQSILTVSIFLAHPVSYSSSGIVLFKNGF